MAKKKAWTKTKLNKELWTLVANYIKKRDSNRCWHCKKVYNNKSAIHCSHILPKAEYPKYKYQSWNLKTLCMHCHLHWWHKSPLIAAKWLQDEYPDQYRKAMKMAEPEVYEKQHKQTYEEKMKLYLKLKTVI